MLLFCITRIDPPLPLARLRARNQLAEIRDSDLRFTTEETVQFFHETMALDLPSESVTTFDERVEGWIAGLQLAAISAKGHQSDGSLTLYVESLMNTEAPLATIQFKTLGGRSIQEVIPDYPSDEELAAMSLLTIDLGGEMATVVDNLPRQDVNRRVIALHENRIINIMIARIGPEYGDIGEQAEVLYTTMTESFHFIGIEPEAPLIQ